MNHVELVFAWQKYRDQDAAAKLFAEVEKLRDYICNKYSRIHSVEFTEYQSIADVVFTDAINSYSDKNVKFSTYFAMLLFRRIRNNWRLKRVKTKSLSNRIIITKPKKTHILEYCSLLPPLNAKIIWMKYQDNKTDAEIATDLNLNRLQITRLHHKSLKQLKEALA